MSRGITVESRPLGPGVEGVGDEHHQNPDAGDDRAALADVPEVIGAQRLYGEPDYLIRVVSADLTSYQRLYESVLLARAAAA